MTTTTDNTFVSQLAANTEEYKDTALRETYCSQVRELAAEHFLQKLLASPEARTNFEASALHRSKSCDQKTVRLEQWQGRGPAYLDQCLSDLLDLGDLVQRLQDHLDQTYGRDSFRVFNHPVRKTRSMALVVSWDASGFSNADDILQRNRAKAQERQERLLHRRDGEEEDEEEAQTQSHSRPAPRRNYDDDRRQPAPRRNYSDTRGRRFDNDSRGPPRREDQSRGRAPSNYQSDRQPREQRESREPRERETPQDARPSRRRTAVASYD